MRGFAWKGPGTLTLKYSVDYGLAESRTFFELNEIFQLIYQETQYIRTLYIDFLSQILPQEYLIEVLTNIWESTKCTYLRVFVLINHDRYGIFISGFLS